MNPAPTPHWSDAVVDTLRAEFSDIPDVAQIVRIVVRLLLAAVLGGILGYEREQQGKAAGIRTHMLVSLGAALFVLVPQQGGMVMADMSRVLQGVIAGVGFLGAGAIIKHKVSPESVQGLTTAAGIWMTAAIGIACGLGREATAVLSMLLALGVLTLVPRLFSPPQNGRSLDHEDNVDSDADTDTDADADADADVTHQPRRRATQEASPPPRER